MIEVDVFWSFAIGASLAACAARHLETRDGEAAFVNRYFVYTVLFLSCVFVPSGTYLLYAFPGWETMYFLDLPTLSAHPMLPTLFALTNTLNGVLGFWWAHRRIRRGDTLGAHTLWTTAYVGMFTILGLGYTRFLYTGSSAEWAAGVSYPLTRWFWPLRADSVLVALLVMGIPMLPGLWLPMYHWSSNAGYTQSAKRAIVTHVLTTTARAVGAACLVYGVWVTCVASDEWRAYLAQPPVGPFGVWAPAVGVVVANTAMAVLAYWPLLAMRAVPDSAAATAAVAASRVANGVPHWHAE